MSTFISYREQWLVPEILPSQVVMDRRFAAFLRSARLEKTIAAKDRQTRISEPEFDRTEQRLA
jgi:hypothetical protein